MTAEEKQATRSGICFSAVISEQTSDAIGHKAPQARVCEPLSQKKNKQCEG